MSEINGNTSCQGVLFGLVILAGVLFGGVVAGIAFAQIAAPTSGLASFIGFFMFPTAFVSALFAWAGFGLAGLFLGFAIDLGKTRSLNEAASRSSRITSPPGKLSLFLVSASTVTLFAILVSLFSPFSMLLVSAVGGGLGLLYGLFLYGLARLGLLDNIFAMVME